MKVYREVYETIMELSNPHNISCVERFINLYGETLHARFPDESSVIFRRLDDADNTFGDALARLGRTIYISERVCRELCFTPNEVLAAIAHEIGHIAYRTDPFGFDPEQRADSLTYDIGLGQQMIGVIEKLLLSRRYRQLTSSLVGRIHFLQNLEAEKVRIPHLDAHLSGDVSGSSARHIVSR